MADGLASLLRAAPARIAISIRPAEVTSISAGETGWRVGASEGVDDFDEVLIATGHARSWSGEMARGWDHAAPLVERVFPVEAHLGADRVAAGARVAVRGFALTFIDAALALTEGRGGQFEHAGDASLRYRASGHEPSRILPFSRTGKPMLAKPDPGARPDSEHWLRATSNGRELILGLPEGFSVHGASSRSSPDGRGERPRR